MELTEFAQDYTELAPGEQALFSDTVRRLLTEGMVWREDEKDRRAFSFLQRHRDLVQAFIAVGGWELYHNELLGIFRVQHRDGAHHRRLNRDTTVWLLVLRLLYAEKRERMEVITTPNPVVQLSEIIQRYTAFFPGQVVRKRTSLQEALRALAGMKLVRLHRMSTADPTIELLSTLEEIVPAKAISEVAARIADFARPEVAPENQAAPEEQAPVENQAGKERNGANGHEKPEASLEGQGQ